MSGQPAVKTVASAAAVARCKEWASFLARALIDTDGCDDQLILPSPLIELIAGYYFVDPHPLFVDLHTAVRGHLSAHQTKGGSGANGVWSSWANSWESQTQIATFGPDLTVDRLSAVVPQCIRRGGPITSAKLTELVLRFFNKSECSAQQLKADPFMQSVWNPLIEQNLVVGYSDRICDLVIPENFDVWLTCQQPPSLGASGVGVGPPHRDCGVTGIARCTSDQQKSWVDRFDGWADATNALIEAITPNKQHPAVQTGGGGTELLSARSLSDVWIHLRMNYARLLPRGAFL